MSNNGSGAGGAVAVFAGMALMAWVGYIIAIMALGMFIMTVLAAVVIIAGLFAYLRGIWECASSGDTIGIAVLTVLPPAATLVSFALYIDSPVADYMVGVTRELMIPHGDPSSIALIVSLVAIIAALTCLVMGPVGTYAVVSEGVSEYLPAIALAALPWVYLGLFSGFCYAEAQVYGW